MSLKTTLKDRPGRTTKVYRTQDKLDGAKGFKWWEESNSTDRAKQLVATVDYLKSIQGFRLERAASYARLYGGMPLMGFVGKSLNTVDRLRGLTPNRPTYNLVSSVVDTLVSKLTQDRPQPVFLTDNGDYKERNLAKKLNNFILGEFYRTKAYEIGEFILTDALVQGTGCLKILETQDNKVGIERVLLTELFVDLQESAYGDPRRLYQVKLMDRAMVEALFPKEKKKAADSISARIDNTAESTRSLADLIMVVEGWSLPSGENTGDGFHSIACSEGELFHEQWEKEKFPFVFLHHKKRQMGFWSIGTSESLMPTQLELNSLLDTISRSIKLCGVPRVFVEEGSKCNTASFVNKIGTVIKYRGAAPIFSVSPSNAPELYEERARLIQFGFEQEGLSMLSATSQKPAGLNSGEAQRVYQDINSDRFAALERRYTNFYVDLAYQIIDKAMEIAERDGKYATVFTDRKKGCKEIELPDISLLQNPFVIQAYVQSSLPKEPAGRLQKVTEMIQSNMISIQEGRRLLDFPDLGQIETLANSSEERIFQYLDNMIDEGKYQGPDQWMDLAKATEICTQYINLYSTCNLEEEKMQMLRDFFAEIQDLQMAAMPQPPMLPPEPQNQLALPQPLPRSEMLPQGGGGGIPMMAEGGIVENQKKNPNLTESDLPEWLQKVRETTVPAFQAASEAVQSIPGIDLATQAFELTSPAAYAFRQAGTPTPEGGILEQVSHVPGAQVAADIPIGWKVLKGQGKTLMDDIKSLQEKLINKQSEMLNNPMSPNTKTRKLFEIAEIEKDIHDLKSKLKLKSSPQLEVTRTPEELAQMAKKEGQEKFIERFWSERYGYDVLKGKLDLDTALEESKKSFKSWTDQFPENLMSPQEKENYANVDIAEIKKYLEPGIKKQMLRNAGQLPEQLKEQERLKNVVVPIEIEGGPLPKGSELPGRKHKLPTSPYAKATGKDVIKKLKPFKPEEVNKIREQIKEIIKENKSLNPDSEKENKLLRLNVNKLEELKQLLIKHQKGQLVEELGLDLIKNPEITGKNVKKESVLDKITKMDEQPKEVSFEEFNYRPEKNIQKLQTESKVQSILDNIISEQEPDVTADVLHSIMKQTLKSKKIEMDSDDLYQLIEETLKLYGR